ncbi:SRPBCC family protein [Salininema proteolyticum]|uniref:SRPBCC family protein n=1 Tax=Salininema proteolyticum TaxID=1607685 RepID=A0ABV8TU80_9ACTN
MRNVHTRVVHTPVDNLSDLLETLASADDKLWPTSDWWPIRLDDGLKVGSEGGHGPVRYEVVEYEPGRRVRFRFAPDFGLQGEHEFRVESEGHGARITHVMTGGMKGSMVVLWPLVVRWMHDALLEQLMDNAERHTTGEPAKPHRMSAWVRLWRRILVGRAAESDRHPARR